MFKTSNEIYVLNCTQLISQFVLSFNRMDDDQCARKNAQRFFDVVDPDYYEFEGIVTHP